MANAYFTFPALLFIYAAQRAVDLSATIARPRLATLPKWKHLGALRTAANSG